MIEVKPTGSKDAKLWVIGEAPGSHEISKGIPFCGPSGNVLWSSLLKRGIRRAECRVDNIIQRKLKGNKWETASEEEKAEGVQRLQDDIRSGTPNLVLLLGAKVISSMLGLSSVDNWRGSLLKPDSLGCKVLIANHPARILRQYEALPLFLFDMGKVKRHYISPELKQIDYKLKLNPTLGEVFSYLETKDFQTKKKRRIAFDIETYPDPSKRMAVMRCIGFAKSRSEAICIPTVKSYWGDEKTFQVVMHHIKKVLEDPDIEKDAQNGQYDCAVLREAHDIHVESMTFDTMCAQHTCYPELPKGLGVLISIYTDEAYHKGMGHPTDSEWVPSEDYYRYNALDAARTFHVAEEERVELKDLGLWDFYHEVVHPLIGLMLELHHNGVRVDVEQFLKVRLGEEMKYNVNLSRLQELVGYDLNPNSPKQVAELLYEGLKLPVQRKRGAVTTEAKALRKLQAKVNSSQRPIFDLIVGVKRAAKNIGTYLNPGLVRKGRMHTSYNIGARVENQETGRTKSAPPTGRISSSRSIVLDSGTNLQNFPRVDDIDSTRVTEAGEITFTYKSNPVRSIVVPEKGEILLEADLAQAEARVVAYLSSCQRLIEMYEKGEKDVHTTNASWIFDVAYDEVKKLQRQFAKTHVHAFNYDEGEQQFAALAGAPIRWARKIRGWYFEEFPEIRQWHQSIQRELKQAGPNHRTLFTLLGRRRTFFGRFDDSTYRTAYAYKPQGTVGDLLNIIFINVWRRMREEGLKSSIRLQVHDSMAFSCPREELHQMAVIIGEESDITLESDGRKFKVPIEFKIGPRWSEMKDWSLDAAS